MRAALLCAVLVLSAGTLQARDLPLPGLTNQVDQLFAAWSRSESPGCSVAVTDAGRIILERGYGMADLEQGVAIRPDTVFNIASASKQFTATAMLLLAEQGKLSLDDDVRKYLPELPDYGAPITLRQLGNHTSGLRDFPELLALGGWNWLDDVPLARALDVIVRQKHLNFAPGSEYLYSNTGYLLLGVIVQRVSGQSLGAYAFEHIFQPLGMLHTRFYDDRRMIAKGRAMGHVKRASGEYGAWRPTYEIVGDGAVLTTVQDLALWERNFLDPYLGLDPAKLVAQLTEPGRLGDGKKIDYGFGLDLREYRGLRMVSHAGNIPGYAAFMVHFPDQRVGVRVLCNLGGLPARKLGLSIADLYLEGQFTGSAAETLPSVMKAAGVHQPVSPRQLQEYTGTYYSEELDARHAIRVDGDGLLSSVGYLPPIRLTAIGPDRFEYAEDGLSISFTRDRAGRVNGYKLDVDRARGIEFSRAETR